MRARALVILLILVACASETRPTATAGGPVLGDCPILPFDNIWNAPVDTLPVHASSSTYISSIGADTGLHPDFGSGTWEGWPIGIPYTVVNAGTPRTQVTFEYDDESDPGPYPIPPNPKIEGDPGGDGDRHILIVERETCMLYELFATSKDLSGAWQAGSGAIFNLRTNELRPDTWTSADAAGLPILPGLARYEEVGAGEIEHALRFTADNTANSYIWPARHEAGCAGCTETDYPPMGLRVRLKASFDISGFSPDVQVILRALKKYGMILADNGSNWYISGAPDERWDNDVLRELRTIYGSSFEAVDTSSLMLNANSGRVPFAPLDTPTYLPLNMR